MTKGHYDASFESEFIPQTTYGGPVQQQQQNNSMTSGPGVRPTMTSIDSITAVSSVSGSMYNTISSVPGGTINSGPSGTINSGPGGTGQPNNLGPNNLSLKGSMKRAPPLAHSAKKSVFSCLVHPCQIKIPVTLPRDLEMVLRDLEEVPRDGLALIWCYMGLPVTTLQPPLQLCRVPLSSSSNNSNHTVVGLDLFQLFVLKTWSGLKLF